MRSRESILKARDEAAVEALIARAQADAEIAEYGGVRPETATRVMVATMDCAVFDAWLAP